MLQQKISFNLDHHSQFKHYNSWPYIGSYKEDFLIITDVGPKNTLNKIKQLKEDY